MSRIDKYGPATGGFRIPLAAASASTEAHKIKGVSINASGKAVIGGTANTDIVGLICPTRAMAAGEIIDVMTAGEIVEATMTAGTALSFATLAGRVYVHLDGTIDQTATLGKLVGQLADTVSRLVVRCPLT